MTPEDKAKRQEWLYNWLYKKAKEEPNKWWSEWDIAVASTHEIKELHYEYTTNAKGSKCSAIYSDMDEINDNYHYDKVIVTKDRLFKMCTDFNDVKPTLDRFVTKRNNASHRLKMLRTKVAQDGQLTLYEEELSPYAD